MQALNEQMLKKIFWMLLAAIFVYMAIVVPHYGITGDEVTQRNYGKFVWDYISSFGADKTVLTDPYILKKELQYYGGFFDGFASMLTSIFHPKDEFLFRHYWTMLFSFTGIMATGLLAKEIKGWLAAILAVVFLFFTGRYFGEAFSNPKDAPFAATYALALYAMIIWLKNIENLKWKHTILMGLSVALCISIRIGGLLLVAYMLLFYAVTVWQNNIRKTKAFSNSIKHLIVAGVLGYIVAILWWPYALEAPLSNPLEALRVMSTYPLFVKMLFEGHRIDTSMVPWYYLPKWLLIGLPLYLLVGFAGGILFILNQYARKKPISAYFWMVMFAALFPVLYILYKKSVLYDGLRHAMFVIPPMVVVAAVYFSYEFDRLKANSGKYALAGIIVILVALPARFMFANHPNEYVYFNELAGGIKSAYGIYETDYYMNSVKQGYKWLIENELNKRPANDTAVIATNCAEPFVEYEKVSPIPFRAMYSRFYEKNQKDWDYAVYYGRFLDKEQLQKGYFPSSMAIHVIEVDGVPICAILKNDPERNGYKGFTAKQEKDLPKAIEYFSKAVKKYPEDMELWSEMAESYAMMGNLDSAQVAVDKALTISSLDLQTAFMAGQIAMQRRDFKKAEQIFTNVTTENPNMGQAYLQLGVAQASMGNLNGALENVNTAIDVDPSVAQQGNELLQKIRAAKNGR